MQTATYEQVAQELGQALDFCAGLGLTDEVAASRFKTYRDNIERLMEAIRKPRPSPVSEEIDDDTLPYLIAVVEATEFNTLLPFLKSCDPEVLRPKLRDVLRGPELPLAEDDASGQARNILFELNLASKLWQAGLKPELGEHPDVACTVDGKLLLIECKRPVSARSAKDAVSRARRQILRHLKKRPAGTRGVAALSMSKIMNRGDKLFAYDTEAQGREGLHRHLLDRTERFSDSWTKLPDSIVGVVFHVITPAVNRITNMYISAQHTNIHPLAKDGSLDQKVFRTFGRALEELWNADPGRAERRL
ncbi:MAG TPA: hypothetical protein VGB13_10700 [Candidatus Krumholzibacteria bacterium]